MTPTEQDKLREQIHKLFGDHQADDGGYQSCYDGKWIDMTNEVCAVATWHTRKLNEARIDEIRRVRPHLTYPGMVYYGERMNELRGDETEEIKQYER